MRGEPQKAEPPEVSAAARAVRILAWVGLVLLLGAYAYLAFRQDSSFFTVPWMPREMARRILSVTHYRNFWGFGFLGFYAAATLGAWWWLRRGARWQWGTIALWLLPVAKELMQSPIHGRHGTWQGALYGVGGAALGLALGCALRVGWRGAAGRIKHRLSRRHGEHGAGSAQP